MKKLIVAAALAVSLMGSARGDAIDWYNTVILLDSSGATVAAGWIVQMYVSGDLVINGFAAGTSTPNPDDTLIARSTLMPGGGFFFTTFDPTTVPTVPDGTRVYSVIFNAATIGAATEAAIIDSAVHTVLDSTTPAANDQYDTGGTLAGDWFSVVPEPSTMVLAGIGGLLLIVRRMRKA